jgi:hypothetical protein
MIAVFNCFGKGCQRCSISLIQIVSAFKESSEVVRLSTSSSVDPIYPIAIEKKSIPAVIIAMIRAYSYLFFGSQSPYPTLVKVVKVKYKATIL